METILFTLGAFTFGLILGVCIGSGYLDEYGKRW